VPDDPNNPLYMPCTVISIYDCFSDMMANLHPTYVARHENKSLASSNLPYYTRPALNNISSAEIRTLISKGCDWNTPGVKWLPNTIMGGRKWNDAGKTLLKRADSTMGQFYLEGPKRIKFRLSISKPDHANEEDIQEALDLHSKVWTDLVVGFNKNSKYVEVAILSPSAIRKLEKQLEEPVWGLMIAGGVSLWWYLFFSLASWKAPLASRVTVGSTGIAVAGFATFAAGGLYFICGKQLNIAIVGCVPFLALGLGVNDMLILTRGFSEIGVERIKTMSISDILGEVLGRAGVGVTLTSLCNMVAFGLASFVPIPALADFCICIVLDSLMNYIAMMTIFPYCLKVEAQRIKKRQADGVLWPCHQSVLRGDRDSSGPESCVETPALKCLTKRVAPGLASWTGGLVALALGLSSIGLSVYPIATQSVGYNPPELVPEQNPLRRSLELIFRDFNLFPCYLVFHGIDDTMDVAKEQAEMLKLYDAVTSQKYTARGPFPHYLTMFYFHAAFTPAVNNTNMVPAPADVPAGMADFGLVRPDRFQTLFNEWRRVPWEDPSSALGGGSFVLADLVFANEFKYSADGGLFYSHVLFFISGSSSDSHLIETIKSTRAIVEASPLKDKAYVYGDVFTYWATFIGLDKFLYNIIGISICVMFVSALLLLQSLTSAVIVAVMSMVIVMNMYATMNLFVEFNSFTVAAVLAGVGLSIEFTAHVTSSFVLAPGTPEQRLVAVMQETYPAILQGSLSTTLSILPLVFHQIEFISLYLCIPFLILTAVGMFHGTVVLPGVLALSARILALLGLVKPKSEESMQNSADAEVSSERERI